MPHASQIKRFIYSEVVQQLFITYFAILYDITLAADIGIDISDPPWTQIKAKFCYHPSLPATIDLDELNL